MSPEDTGAALQTLLTGVRLCGKVWRFSETTQYNQRPQGGKSSRSVLPQHHKIYKIRHKNLVCGSWVTFIKKKNQIYNYVTFARTGNKKSDIDDKAPLIMYRGLLYKWHKIKKKNISKKLHSFCPSIYTLRLLSELSIKQKM